MKTFYLKWGMFSDALLSSLIDSNVNMRWKQRKSKELGTCSLAHNTLGVLWARDVLELRDGTRKNDKHLITHIDLHKPNNKLVSA